MGKPVLVTRCGGPEGFVNEKVGILVDKGSAQALYEGMLEMLRRKEWFNGKEIKNYARERFDNGIICDRYIDVYRDIIL